MLNELHQSFRVGRAKILGLLFHRIGHEALVDQAVEEAIDDRVRHAGPLDDRAAGRRAESEQSQIDFRLSFCQPCVLEAFNFSELKSDGYCFSIEIAYLAHQKKFKIKEVPITFTERTRGRSKISRKIILEAAIRVPLLRLSSLR